MALTTENIFTMANWTLEDIQNDPLEAVKQVRVLAASYLALQRERDAAVKTLYGNCVECKRNRNGFVSENCYNCVNLGGTEKNWEWRGPMPEGGAV